MPSARFLVTTLLLLGALGVAAGAAVQFARGRVLLARPGGVVRDVRDVRRRSAAALVEAVGIAVLGLGLLAHHRVLVTVGALLTAGGALMMSVARRGLARRRR